MTRAEPPAVVKQTINALLAIKSHADEILVIDNNHTNETLYKPLEQYCNSLPDTFKVRFHHIDNIAGYKAGALNLALQLMDKACDYIVVIDSDYQVLPWARSRIESAVKRFPDHALLQFPQYYRDSDKTDIHNELNHYFSYHLNKPHNKYRALSTGTCAVIKKEALVKLGGWCENSITEDAQMGVLMHFNKERSHYINEVIATGMLPLTMVDFIAQRQRWIYGNMQVFRNYACMMCENKSLKSSKNKLSVDEASFNPQISKPIFLKSSFLKSSLSKKYQDKDIVSDKRPSKLKNLTAFNLRDVRYLRAHLSQLGAWVNPTGVFIILHGVSLSGLIIANLFTLEVLVAPLINTLKLCYAAYAVFMARRLWAFLSDSKPLSVPEGNSVDTSVCNTTGASTDTPAGTSSNVTERSLCNISYPISHPIKKERAKLYLGQLFSRIKRKLFDKSELKRPYAEKTSIVNRVRAWLIHLNFWEIGALSWFPVLLNQDKPFVCTPKIDTSQQNPVKHLCVMVRVLPKLLIVLNAITIATVWPYSKLLIISAMSVLVCKILAGWVLAVNFSKVNTHLKRPITESLQDTLEDEKIRAC